MPRFPHELTDAELAVMQLLWERGPCGRPQIAEALYGSRGATQYGTVQTLLRRLERKGFVRRERAEGGLLFAPALSRESVIGRSLAQVADKLCGGSFTPLLMNLVRARPLSPDELRELQDSLAELRRQTRRRGKQP
jgi:predicted transcriptional regulator